uniref:Stabilin 2 n=1 Tax=Electrophorus electricus TaxID=8005 RepID=A0AAY5EJ47_ELEEL
MHIDCVCVHQNRCDRNIQVMTKTDCHSCSISAVVDCPPGYSKKTPGKGKQDCRCVWVSIANLLIAGCSHECYKDVVEERCCPGYWGNDCIECPDSAAKPCSNNGVCSDGTGGNGTCTCKAGFVGTACEKCEENMFGHACNNVCTCKHGLCNSGVQGTGQCTCFSGYTGPDCDQELPNCAVLRCEQNALCFEDISSGKLVCKCKPGFFGNGVQCTSINPCLRKVCHEHAVCVHTGPNQHSCTCAEGYQGDGLVCMPVDPCQTNFGGCLSNSTGCVYDGPGKAHCECLEGFEKLVMGVSCSLKDACKPDSCHKNVCLMTFICEGVTHVLLCLVGITEAVMSWPLTSRGPFTVFVPSNKAFKSTSVKTLMADEAKARYLVKLHMVAVEMNSDTLKNGILYYTLTGKTAESVTESEQVKVRIHGSRRKGLLLESNIIASNGVIHITDKMMDTVPPTVISDSQENLMKILSDNGKFSQFKSLLEKTNMVAILDEAGPYTVFAPTNTAFSLLKDGYLDYLVSDEGNSKLLELMRNHIVSSAQLSVSYIISSAQTVSMANQVLAFNVTLVGQILINGVAVVETDVEAKNGRLYSLDGILIPPTIEPILPHRCDVTENVKYKGLCVSCSSVTRSTCPTGVSMVRRCLLHNFYYCTPTETPQCCKGFFGSDCSPCPGGFTAPCSSHGMCFEGIDGNGTCQCEPNFKGSRCQYCADPNKYGPSCDQTCGCVQGVCDNRPEAHGTCKSGSCKPGFSGQLCDKHTQPCGPKQPCHAHADCVYSEGELMCVCKLGFKGNGFLCVESDPCTSPPNGGCSNNARCIKTGPGTRRCECLKGWKEDGDECQPVNNCVEPSRGGCHPNASCVHVGPGQNYCMCKKNYRGNGKDCEAINQCVDQIGGCHQHVSCLLWNGLQRADLKDMLTEGQNMTLFVPSEQAIGTLSKEDQDYWLAVSNLPSLVKSHMVSGFFALAELRSSPSPELVSLLKKTLPVSWTNETTRVAGAKIVSGDIVAKNGFIHLIDTVLISDRKMSEGLLEVLNQRPQFSIFRDMLLKFNLTEEMESASGFTLFAPTDSAITEYLKNTGESSLDLNVTRYHIVLGDTLRQADLQDGLYKDTMLGFSYQIGIFCKDSNWWVNKALVTATDILTSKGVIHEVSAVLKVPKNRCDTASTKIVQGQCMDCFHPTESRCPPGTQQSIKRTKCAYSRRKHGMFIGCEASCQKRTIVRKCCEGFYGLNCESCPGPEGQPCFGNGVCVDGINGTGACRCNPGFNGTACESCQTGKYGIHCDQDCKCVNGHCNDGQEGDGTCECDVGWRGILCSIAITTDSCKGTCHTSANCLLNVADNSYYCRCAAGYQGNGTYCTAVNACAKDNGGCSSSAVCKITIPGRRKCVCNPGYAGDGKVCVSINPCLDGSGRCSAYADCVHTGPNKVGFPTMCMRMCICKNGGCHKQAICMMKGPGERNCTCRKDYMGDGMTCKSNVMQVREIISICLCFQWSDAYFLQGRGPYTVFAPNNKNKESNAALVLYHIVSCRILMPEDLMQPRNLTTLSGETLTISYSEGSIYINNKAKVVYSDQESNNGIFHEIDTVLIPPSFQKLNGMNKSASLVANEHGFKTFFKLLEDTEVMERVQDRLHQPVTLFLPTDSTMAALPQEQKDFLFGLQNRAQLKEYLEYHVLHDMKSAEMIHFSSMKTLQGSDISVSCVGEDQIGELYISDKSCRIVKRNLKFNGGLVYGIDCLLTPPSLGGRCDQKDTVDITMPCRYCAVTVSSDCPSISKPKSIQRCDLPRRFSSMNAGCQSVCTMVIWKPKCCSGYYGRDCLACPGGPRSPCSNHGQCDEDHLGNGTCTCFPGYQGVACELCIDGHFGPECKACNCSEHGSCDESPDGTGSCFCDEGWTGPQCEHKLVDSPVCVPACHAKAVCAKNNSCVCKPFYEGDGLTCTERNNLTDRSSGLCSLKKLDLSFNRHIGPAEMMAHLKPFSNLFPLPPVADLCGFWNGGCSKNANCSQKDEKVNCTCLTGYSGDGHVCSPVDPCVTDDNGGCHEHAICTMTGAVNKTVGVFHYRSPLGVYKLNYTQAQEACKQEGGTIATYTQLSYAQQAGYSLCSAGWLEQERVAYPMSYSHLKCGFGHVGIVDYGKQTDLSRTWDTFCYRPKDVKCECKMGYIGDGYTCTGNLLQVLSSKPNFSNFLSQILNCSRTSASGQEFVRRLSNITTQSTLFVPDNDGLYENETLSYRDLEHHLLDGRALVLQALINVSHVRTHLGHTLSVKGVPSLQSPQTLASSGYVNDRYIIESDIFASNGIIHVLHGPLKAPPPPAPSLHPAHKAGMGIGVLLLIILIMAGAFVAYHFYTQQSKPFQFHYFKEDENEDSSPSGSAPYISNPTYESTPAPTDPHLPADEVIKRITVTDYSYA